MWAEATSAKINSPPANSGNISTWLTIHEALNQSVPDNQQSKNWMEIEGHNILHY